MATAVLLLGQPAHAQTTHSESVTKHTGPGPNVKVKSEMVSGKVIEYEPGKDIEIEGPGGKDYKFHFNANTHIEGSIVEGQMATIHYTKKDDGTEHVLVLAAGKDTPMPMAKHEHAAAPKAGTMHTETTSKHSGPGPNTKSKIEIVEGTVKEYEAGEKIVVSGPEEKEYSFDLDELVRVTGPIAKGSRVRVEYTKLDDGTERVSILSAKPKTSASTKRKS